ncbi:MAG: DUF3189 family protein, partial [Dethiobacteria bacterium]
LPRTLQPRLDEILALPYFDRAGRAEVGTLHYAGRNPGGNSVFILGSRHWGAEVRGQAAALLRLAASPMPKVAVIDCLPHVTLPVRLGGYISQRLGLTAIGRPLVGRGILWNYSRILELVELFERDPTPNLL